MLWRLNIHAMIIFMLKCTLIAQISMKKTANNSVSILPAKQYDGIYVRNRHIYMKDVKSGMTRLPFDGTIKGKLFGQEVKYIQKWIDLAKKEGTANEKQALDKISVEQLFRHQKIYTAYT